MSTIASIALAGIQTTTSNGTSTTEAAANATTTAAQSGVISNETLGLWFVLGLLIAVVAFGVYDS